MWQNIVTFFFFFLQFLNSLFNNKILQQVVLVVLISEIPAIVLEKHLWPARQEISPETIPVQRRACWYMTPSSVGKNSFLIVSWSFTLIKQCVIAIFLIKYLNKVWNIVGKGWRRNEMRVRRSLFQYAAMCIGRLHMVSAFDFCFFASVDSCSAERRRQLPTHSRLRQSARKGAAKDTHKKQKQILLTKALFCCWSLQRIPTMLPFKLNNMCVTVTIRERRERAKVNRHFLFVFRHWEAPTRARNQCTCPSATRSVWTRPCGSHTPAAATGSQSPSDRYTHTSQQWVHQSGQGSRAATGKLRGSPSRRTGRAKSKRFRELCRRASGALV